MFKKMLIANRGEIACRMSAMLQNRDHAAWLRSAVLALAAGTMALPAAALACGVLTPEGEARLERQQKRWLHKETDLKVRGAFAYEAKAEVPNEDGQDYNPGIITAADESRYRVLIRLELSCSGFPNTLMQDGERGLFHLRRSKHPRADDIADGVIDNYDLIHFRSGRGK